MSLEPCHRRSVTRIGAFLLCFAGAFAPGAAFGQPKSDTPTPGEKLFREGREAMDRKELALACSKFKDSFQAEHVVTSLLNEADCEEKRGRLATSLGLWRAGAQKADDASTKSFAEKRITPSAIEVPSTETVTSFNVFTPIWTVSVGTRGNATLVRATRGRVARTRRPRLCRGR